MLSASNLFFVVSSRRVFLYIVLQIANKEAELVDLTVKYKPDVLCVQETMPSKQTSFQVVQRIIQRRMHKLPSTRRSSHLHPRNNLSLEIDSYHSPQTIAPRFNIGKDVTIVSICNSRSRNTSVKL